MYSVFENYTPPIQSVFGHALSSWCYLYLHRYRNVFIGFIQPWLVMSQCALFLHNLVMISFARTCYWNSFVIIWTYMNLFWDLLALKLDLRHMKVFPLCITASYFSLRDSFFGWLYQYNNLKLSSPGNATSVK